MANLDFDSEVEELRKHLDSNRQNWLFGAGISYCSNIPLMVALTERVEKIVTLSSNEKSKEIYQALTKELMENSHIEHYLSTLSDLLAIAERSKEKQARLGEVKYTKDEFSAIYGEIISAIGETVRYGYKKNEDGEEIIGSAQNPIVEIEHHLKFIQALFTNRSNLLTRSNITFFSLNYDTLLEDSLAMEKIKVLDGFSGGAMGYWDPEKEFSGYENYPNKCFLYKLHGSIDWQRDNQRGLVRVRYGTNYLADTSTIMIYPQANKYVETQKDPFAHLFSGLRNALGADKDNVLVTCGYSFGDEHVNAAIEVELLSKKNRTTLLAFAKEMSNGDVVVNNTLDIWLKNPQFGDRVYVAGENGLYHNSITPIQPEDKRKLSWWTFSGLTKFIISGEL
jgi:hypothetical protein